MKIVAIIPARYASTRFPGKPLVDIEGKPMIQHVYEQVIKCDQLAHTLVATDDDRIYEKVKEFGGTVRMTSPHHTNGTERCAEVALQFYADYYINIQGDEPFIHPSQISTLCNILDGKTELGTLVKRITDVRTLENHNVIKVVCNHQDEALYFSRSCIPYIRNRNEHKSILQKQVFYKHIGMYAYKNDVLSKISTLPESPLEKIESLEQLRWLQHGFKIKIIETSLESKGIDTPEDLEKIKLMNT